jgi:hypothetical protein
VVLKPKRPDSVNQTQTHWDFDFGGTAPLPSRRRRPGETPKQQGSTGGFGSKSLRFEPGSVSAGPADYKGPPSFVDELWDKDFAVVHQVSQSSLLLVRIIASN